MSNGWKYEKLNDLCTRIGDGLHGTPQYSLDTDYFFINGNNLRGGKIVINKETKKVSESEYKKNHIELNSNSLLLGINGTLGNMAFYNDEKIILGKSSAYLNFKTGINRFYYYYFQLDGIQKYFYDVATGSTIKNLSLQSIQQFSVPVPEESEWKSIVAVLQAIDNKISINNKINSELEKIVRITYDYWFTQFDFPDSNGKPYKSSGGKMIYNEQLKREIPSEWSIKCLNQVISRSGTGLNPRDNFKLGNGNNYYVTIKSVENGKVMLDDRCDKIDDHALTVIQKRSDLQVGDILFTSIQPVGVTYLIYEKPTNWNINESVFTLRPNYEEASSEFIYMLLSGEEMSCYTENSSTGSVHKGIRHSTLKEFKFACPDKKLIDEFTDKVMPMLRAVYNTEEENRMLTELRNWLLPMIMTSKLKVN